jgi:DNA-binding SARP family transcriptional activator
MINVGILGPTVVAWDGHDVSLSSLGTVVVLILAVSPGHVATSGDIQRKAWPEREPDDQTSARLRSAVLAMRSRFASAIPVMPARAACPPYRAILTGRAGYQLPVVTTDADLFAGLARQARLSLGQGDAHGAWLQACAALELWRGTPLGDAGGRSFAIAPALRLEQARIAAELTRCEAALLLGLHREVFPDLERLAAAWPGDFGITCLLVTALVRCGRIGEAAEACYKALSYAQEHGLDDTDCRQLQYAALSGNIAVSGPPWRP